MKTKNKLIIAFSALGVVAVGAIVLLVAVLAAQQQVVTSNITVTYTTSDVATTVTAKLKRKTADADFVSMVLASDHTSTYKVITATDEYTQAAPLQFEVPDNYDGTDADSLADPVRLSHDNNYVLFDYAFSKDGDRDFTIDLSINGTGENTNLLSYVATSVAGFDAQGITTATSGKFSTAAKSGYTVLTTSNATVGGVQKAFYHVFVKIQVEDLGKNVNQDALGFSFNLNYIQAS